MSRSTENLGKTIILLLMCPLIMLLGSCRSAMFNSAANQGSAGVGIGSFFADPFIGPDHVQVSKSHAVMTAINHRAKPS